MNIWLNTMCVLVCFTEKYALIKKTITKWTYKKTDKCFYLCISDRLHISLYRDAADYIKNSPEKTALPLEDFLGIESCFTLDKEPHVMAIVCLHDVTLLAFQGRETLIEWEIRIRSHLGEGKDLILHTDTLLKSKRKEQNHALLNQAVI